MLAFLGIFPLAQLNLKWHQQHWAEGSSSKKVFTQGWHVFVSIAKYICQSLRLYFPAQLNLFSSWSEAAAAKKCPHKGDRLNHSVHPPSSKFWQLFINQFLRDISLIFIAPLPPFYLGFWFYVSTIFTALCFSLAYIGLISEVTFLEIYWQFFNVSSLFWANIG